MQYGMPRIIISLVLVIAASGACSSFDGFTFDRQPERTAGGAVGGGASGGGATTGPMTTGAGGGGAGGGGAGGAGLCSNDHQCVAAAPPDWLGPIALYDGDPVSAPTCTWPFSIPMMWAYADLQSADAVCSACSCSPPAGITCKPDNVWLNPTADCSTGINSFGFSNDGTVCQGNGSISVASIRTWGWDRVGACASPPAQTPTITPTEWGRRAVGCAFMASDDGGCGAGQVCAPNPTAPFDDAGLCVAHSGNVACPASTYTSRRVFYANVDDTRSCAPCTCTLSGTCSGTLNGYSNSSCSTQILSTAASTGCTNTTANYFKYTPNPITNAQCYAGGGYATGCAVPTDPVTVCCTAGGRSCPVDMVEVPSPSGGSYCVDATEVTNARYAQFIASNPPLESQPTQCTWNSDYVPSNTTWPTTWPSAPDFPVTDVDWCDASAYCAWAGKRLCGNISGGSNPIADAGDPTKSQWYAACSRGGQTIYPYGDQHKNGVCRDGMFDDLGAVGAASCCVGGYWGLYDMSGNAQEWEDSCNAASGPSDNCLTRGGSNTNQCAGSAQRPRNTTSPDIGFRCCSP